MKRLAVAAMVVFAAARFRGGSGGMEMVRVLTYNIHHGQGTDGVLDLTRIASIVMSADADLVALQEIDRHTERSGGVDELDELAHRTGMYAAFGKTMDYSGGEYGVGVLSRWPILSAHNGSLPSSPDREPRTELTITTKTGPRQHPLRFTCTHFDQGRDEHDRLMQAESVNRREVRDRMPAILAGDMNAREDSDVIRTLERTWTDATSEAPLPMLTAPRVRYRPDYVFFRPAGAWRVVQSEIIDDRIASDHRPVLAVLNLTH
jgi:endonuclease/exonuclease/phosphatase family metal-dependent hydrolase